MPVMVGRRLWPRLGGAFVLDNKSASVTRTSCPHYIAYGPAVHGGVKYLTRGNAEPELTVTHRIDLSTGDKRCVQCSTKPFAN